MEEMGPRVEEDMALARELGITGVPTFVVNGVLLGRTPDSTGLSTFLLRLLEGP